jgi:hypothetical protein
MNGIGYLVDLMTEENLEQLPLEDLYSLMIRTIEEYLILYKDVDPGSIESKRAELKMIQNAITTKKTGKSFPPGYG